MTTLKSALRDEPHDVRNEGTYPPHPFRTSVEAAMRQQREDRAFWFDLGALLIGVALVGVVLAFAV